MIKLYSSNCPKCNILEKKLNQENIKFEKITDFDTDEMLRNGFTSLPMMNIDGVWYDFKESINYINAIK